MDTRREQSSNRAGTLPAKSKPKNSSISSGFFSTKLCSSCVQPLGLFISRGSCCPKCGLKVCKKCKIYEIQASSWCCLACYKIMKHSRGGIIGCREDHRSASIKRSFSISEASRSSPVLKSYTKYYEDRPYNSLPRMASNIQYFGGGFREGGGHRNSFEGGIIDQKSSLFPSTLHPFHDVHGKKSPTSSVNFIEDEYWDYYDYEINSNRSSCERSLGETVEYQHCVNQHPPRKPERRKCRSMGAFDAKYSQLKTYCVITKDPGKERGSYNSLPRKQKKVRGEREFEKENSVTFMNGLVSSNANNKSSESQENRRNTTKTKTVNENTGTTNNNKTSSLKNRSIVNLKHEPRIQPDNLSITSDPKVQNDFWAPNADGKIKVVKPPSFANPANEVQNSSSVNIPVEPVPSSPYKNQSIHASLRKNKYMDFYNGFTNGKQGSGLYFSLPPMKNHDKEREKSASSKLVSGVERDIPIQFDMLNSSSLKNRSASTSRLEKLENPYAILEQLRKRSEELEEVKKSTGPHKSYTLPKNRKENYYGISSRGAIPPSFTTSGTGTGSSSDLLQEPAVTTLYNHKNNSRKSILTTDKARTGSGDCGSNSKSSREVIIVIERECESPNLNLNKNETHGKGHASPAPPQNPHAARTLLLNSNPNDCDLIERGKPSSVVVHGSGAGAETESDSGVIVTPTPANNRSSKTKTTSPQVESTSTSTKCNSTSLKSGVENLTGRDRMDGDVDVEINKDLLSCSSSSSSYLSNVDTTEEDLGGLVFQDCCENENEQFVFKSCEESEVEEEEGDGNVELKKCIGVEWKGGGGIDGQVRGNNDEGTIMDQMQRQRQFSPGSEASTSSTTSTNTTVKGAPAQETLLLLQHGLSQPKNEENQNMVTTESNSTSCVVLPIPTLQSTSTDNVGGGNHQSNNNQEMSSSSSSRIVSSTPTASTTKKFKSRILVNADCDYDSDGVTNVEISGDQVGIVTGRGTFIRPLVPFHDPVEAEKISRFWQSQGQEDNLLGTSQNYAFTNQNDISVQINNDPGIIAGEESYSYEYKYGSHPPPTKSGESTEYKEYNEKITPKRGMLSKSNADSTEIIPSNKETNDSPENSNANTMSSSKTHQSPFSCRRESPEGEESVNVKAKFDNNGSPDDGILLEALGHNTRSSPDGADKSDDSCPTPNPIVEEPMDDEEGESTDSWTEEAVFEDDDKPPPLDLTLHTIVEESCEESEVETDIPKKTKLNELENYYNFTTEEPVNYEESEFSDTFSESSLSFDPRNSLDLNSADLNFDFETGRLEKYFLNLGLNNDSDSVGSESDSECSVLDNRKKVLKHHRRSAEFEDSQVLVSEDDECAFEQDGLDTIKKQRKLRRSSEDLLDQIQPPSNLISECKDTPEETTGSRCSQHDGSSNAGELSSASTEVAKEHPQPTPVSRSNSFTWSSDEEVNLMMSKLRHLIKNMVHNKKVDEQKNEKLIYLENELVRLMKNENLKNIVESISSDSDEDVYKLFERVESNQPELLNKVMTHIGKRLSTWMKDTDEFTDDGATIKCSPSISSDLNEDRFSWKGSFESTLAKRQSVGSSDSIDGGGAASAQEGNELFSERSILRSSSLHHLATTQPILEECEPLASSLPRLNDNPITSRRTKNALLNHQEVKSGRYRPPGYFEHKETHVSTPTLSTFATEQMQEGFNTSRKNITIRGQIEFLMQYNYKCSTFEISIKQCRDLAAVDTKRGRSDPYVKVYLLPERAKSSKKKTKVKKNTLNPMFGEVLKFPVSLEDLENRILWLTVWHSGLFGKNEFLGEVLLNLRNITFDDINYKWFPLQEQRPIENFSPDEAPEKQNLVLSLALKWSPRTYNRGNLTILIKEAKGLKYIKNSCPSTFVKCSPINEKSKKQKTPLCRKNLNPVWNTTLTFENISNEGIDLAFYNYDLLNHELISSTKLDPDCDVWREMGSREGFWVEGTVTFEQSN